MTEPVDKGMATKRGAIFKTRGIRLQKFNKAKDAWEKAAKHTRAVKASHVHKPDTSGSGRVKKAEAAQAKALKNRKAAFKHYKAKLFKKGGKVGSKK